MQDYTTRCAELERELEAVRTAARAESLAAEVARVTRLLSAPAPGWIKVLVGAADPISDVEAGLLRVVLGDVLPAMPRIDMLNLSMDAARGAASLPGDKSGYPRQWLRKLAQCMDPGTILGTVKFLACPPGVKTMTRGPRKGETVALDKRKEFHLSLARQVVKWLDSTARPDGGKDADYTSPLSFRQRKYVGAFKSAAGLLPDAARAVEDVAAMLRELGLNTVDGYAMDGAGPVGRVDVTDAAVDAAVVAAPEPPDTDEEAGDWAAWASMAGGDAPAFQF